MARSALDELSDPWVILASQMPQRSGFEWTGERRLCAAVMQDAVDLFNRVPVVTDKARMANDLSNARAWVVADAPSGYPFTFRNVCGALGLDPDAARKALLALCDAPRGIRQPAIPPSPTSESESPPAPVGPRKHRRKVPKPVGT